MTLKTLIRVLAVGSVRRGGHGRSGTQVPGKRPGRASRSCRAWHRRTGAGPGAGSAAGRSAGADPDASLRGNQSEIPYSLFVSSKVKKNKKAPLIVTLHGIGGINLTMMRPNAIDLAEAGGYILLAPMGLQPARLGTVRRPPQGRRGRHHRRRPLTPLAAPGAMVQQRGCCGPAAGTTRAFPPGLLSDPNDPPNLRELSERETLKSSI